MRDVLRCSQCCSEEREGSLCRTVSAGSLWLLPGCRSPHRALSRCKVSLWRKSFCEGECSLSVDTSEGRQTKKNFSVCVLTKNYHIRTRSRAGNDSILVLSFVPAEAAPSQATQHTSLHAVPNTFREVLKNNLCLNLPFSSTGISGTLKCASCYRGRFWLS